MSANSSNDHHNGGAPPDPLEATPGAEPEPRALEDDLTIHETVQGPRAGDRYIRVERPYARLFRRVGPGYLRATEETLVPRSWGDRVWSQTKRLLIGGPLSSEREVHERLTKVKALAVFASDAISSTAYATQEILYVLMVAGTGALAAIGASASLATA